jgi:RHS repeat-associated protein
VYYYHADHLGTPQALTDAQGQLALEMDYQAWGEAREVITEAAASAGIRNPSASSGQYHDDESGLHYNRYRYYDPEIGRFISRDPIGLMGGINIHSYAPNPVEWVDPLGLARIAKSTKQKVQEENASFLAIIDVKHVALLRYLRRKAKEVLLRHKMKLNMIILKRMQKEAPILRRMFSFFVVSVIENFQTMKKYKILNRNGRIGGL